MELANSWSEKVRYFILFYFVLFCNKKESRVLKKQKAKEIQDF
jgi:hypothetical protein